MSPQTSIMDVSEDVFRQQVYTLIARELGLGGYARFLMTFCSGKGDYTAERHKWQDGLTVEDICRQIESERGTASSPSTTPPK